MPGPAPYVELLGKEIFPLLEQAKREHNLASAPPPQTPNSKATDKWNGKKGKKGKRGDQAVTELPRDQQREQRIASRRRSYSRRRSRPVAALRREASPRQRNQPQKGAGKAQNRSDP